jgi:hypothetical protein
MSLEAIALIAWGEPDSTMDQIEPRRQARRRCATVIVVAAGGFLVGCFLPYYRLESSLSADANVSLYRLQTAISDTASTFLPRIGGVIYLFGLVIIVLWLAILGLVKDSDWTFGALAGATAVWSLAWIAAALRTIGLATTPQIGYWLVLVSAGVGLVGAILAVASSRSRRGSPVKTVTD